MKSERKKPPPSDR